MNFVYVKNKEGYIKFIDDIRDKFGSIEDWEDFFGFHLNWDEETGEVLETIFEYQGQIEYCPDSFPAIVYWLIDFNKDRFGDYGVKIVDFATFEELGIEILRCKGWNKN